MKNQLVVLVLSIFLLLSPLIGLWRVPQAYAASHGPITINGNSQFVGANGVVSGSGTAENPYVIEGWIISGPGGDGISIKNTDAFFIIRNCNISTVYSSIFGVDYYTGVYFENVTNGRVENNTLFNNLHSIHLNSFSTGNTLINNTIFNSTTRGIWIDANYPYNDKPSNNNTLIGNTIYNTTGPAIYITYSSYNTLSDNNLFNNTDGIYLSYSSYNTLSGNTINLSGRGIYSESGSYNNFSNNTLVNNTDGIRFASNNAHNIIASNTVHDSSNWGISIIGSTNTNNTVKNNICRNNTDGIHIEIAHDSILIGNVVANNTIGFNFYQSYNSGITNCRIFGNANWGVYNYGTNPTYVVNASYNWWGSADGPGPVGPGSGDHITANVLYDPWLTSPSHDPIVITSNSEFTPANGVVDGSGTEGDPYVIEGWVISASAANGITILGTDAFFVIRNCVVSEGSIAGFYGVYLENVLNGRIEGNEFSGTFCGVDLLNSNFTDVVNNNFSNNDYGISLGSLCANCTLTGNTVSNSTQNGFDINGSYNNTIIDNTVTNNGQDGVCLYESSNNTIADNTVGNNTRNGIMVYWNSINNTVTDNYCYNNTEIGIYIYVGSSFNTVVGNTVSGNTQIGVFVDTDAPNNTITRNTVTNSSLGIGASYSHNNTFISNTVLNNSYCGISVDSSSNSTLIDNTIGFNSMGVYIGFSETDNTALLRNTIHNNTQGIYSGGSNVQIAFCLIYNNTDYGVHTESYDPIVNATYNWWGSIDGPSGDGFGSGDVVSSNVNFIPWLTSPSSEVALHDPIVIENDLQFTEENGVVSGFGTIVDPYVIENWTISSESADGISISNTTAFFILRNCTVEGNANYYYNYGIRFNNVTNGRVENNTLLCNYYGINLYDSPNNTLTGNIAINTYQQSIFLDSSDNCTLIDNACSNSYMGICLYYSSNNNLTGNNVCNNGYGIYLETSTFNTLVGNTANSNTEHGFEIGYDSGNNIFTDNTANSNINSGVELDSSPNCVITGSVLRDNYYGVELDYSPNSTVTNCIIANNTYGVYVNSENATITGCSIHNNTDYGIVSNWPEDPVYEANATYNWWGSADGPGPIGPGNGDNISDNVLYDPWLTSPPGQEMMSLVVRGEDDRIYYRQYNYTTSSWNSWSALPSGSTGDGPAAATVADVLYVVVRGMDGSSLWFSSVNLTDSSFSGWTLLSGSTSSTPTLSSNGTALALTVRGEDDRIYYRFYTIASQTWTDWSSLPSGAAPDSPAAVLIGNSLHIVVRGMDGSSLWYSNFNTTTEAFSGWTWLDGFTPSAPTLAGNVTALALIVRGGDDRIYYRFYTISSLTWELWSVLPSGTTIDSPATTIIESTLHLVVRGSDGSSLWQSSIDMDTSAFSGWTGMSGSTPSKPTLTRAPSSVGNSAPVLDPIGPQSGDELTEISFTATASDADLPAQTLTFSLADGVSGSVPLGVSINSSTGGFTWTPTEEQGPNVYTFDVVVSDGSLTDFETITVTVNEVNVAPVLDSIGPRSVDELVELSFTATATDSDIPAQTLTYSLADGVSGSVPLGASIDPSTGAFTWTPEEDQGPDVCTFDVAVSDGDLSDSETITVTVNEVNVAPVLDPIGPQGGDELTEISFTATASDADVLAQPLILSSVPGQTLTFSLSGAVPDGAIIGPSSGVFTWTPTEDQDGSHTFDVVVSDGDLTDSETITVTVNEVNTAPIIDSYNPYSDPTVAEGYSQEFTVTYHDDEGDTLSVTWYLDYNQVESDTDSYTYSPGSGDAGSHTVEVVISDGFLTAQQTWHVTVNEFS